MCKMLLILFISGLQVSPVSTVSDPGRLRYIVIDGSNVAMR